MSENILEKQLFEIIQNKEMEEKIKLAKLDMLVRLGVDVNTLYGAKSALKLANEVKEEKIAKILEDNKARDFIDEEKVNELGEKLYKICASEAENINIAEINELIDMGADVNAEDDSGYTALMEASFNGHLDVVELLIKNGADVNETNNHGATALMWASAYNHIEIVKCLVKNNADVNIKNKEDCTALIWASRYDNAEIVEYLIKNDANIDVKNKEGLTALMLASTHGSVKAIKILIENRANVLIRDDEGYNAITMARDEKTKKTIIDAIDKRNEKENSGKMSLASKIKQVFSMDK